MLALKKVSKKRRNSLRLWEFLVMCCAQKSLKNSQNRRLSAKNAEILHEKTKKWALYTKNWSR